jgi:ATP-dependent DNA ligase
MATPTLYSLDKSGTERYWSVAVEKHGGSVFVTRRYGQVGGKETETSTEIKEGKNIGRSNETTPLQQAQSEAKSLWKKQVEAGFVTDRAKLSRLVLLPMLANKWEDKAKYISEPFYVQPKLDGVRMLVGRLNGKFMALSRTGKPVKMPHVEAELFPRLQEGEFLDGENYTPNLTFEQITGMCRTQDVHSDLESIKFHIFDYFHIDRLDSTFEERTTFMGRFMGLTHCEVVETVILKSKKQVQAKHDEYAAKGYEGIMIRDFSGPYLLANRSSHLLKFKAFQTEEYKIVGAEEGRGRDAGTVIWICTSAAGDFHVRPKGTFEERTKWFKNRNDYMGKNLTVQFQNLTNGGIPRFPVGIAIRDYE